MSSSIKFKITGIECKTRPSCKQKNHPYYYDNLIETARFFLSHNLWKLFGFAVSASMFSMLLVSSNIPRFFSANVFDISRIETVLPTSSDVKIISETIFTDANKGFLYAGYEHKNVPILKVNISSADKIFRLKSFRVKTQGISEKYISELYFVDNSGEKHRSSLEDEYAVFENIYLKIGNETLTFFADFEKTFRFGQRFRFEIERPEDCIFTLYGDEIFSDSAFPVSGDYISIVGNKIAF